MSPKRLRKGLYEMDAVKDRFGDRFSVSGRRTRARGGGGGGGERGAGMMRPRRAGAAAMAAGGAELDDADDVVFARGQRASVKDTHVSDRLGRDGGVLAAGGRCAARLVLTTATTREGG